LEGRRSRKKVAIFYRHFFGLNYIDVCNLVQLFYGAGFPCGTLKSRNTGEKVAPKKYLKN